MLIEKDQLKMQPMVLKLLHISTVDIRQYGWIFAIKIYLYLSNYYLSRSNRSKKISSKSKARLKIVTISFFFSFFTDLQVKIGLALDDFGT
jgi:hypothetical protein